MFQRSATRCVLGRIGTDREVRDQYGIPWSMSALGSRLILLKVDSVLFHVLFYVIVFQTVWVKPKAGILLIISILYVSLKE